MVTGQLWEEERVGLLGLWLGLRRQWTCVLL